MILYCTAHPPFTNTVPKRVLSDDTHLLSASLLAFESTCLLS
jgi:hypothetical protein